MEIKMEEKRVTLKDIAKELKVSLGTVHRAIYNKEGVGEETRRSILAIAEKRGYKVNVVASSLKRSTVKIGVVFPEPVANEKYFFLDVWNGIDSAVNDFKDFNVKVVKATFTGDYTNQIEVMEDFYNNYSNEIDGLITHVWHDTKLNSIINKFADSGIPVVTVTADAPESRRTCFVSPQASKIGLVAGELMSNYITPGGRVIILGGKRESSSHQERVLGFLKAMKENTPETEIIEAYDLNLYYNNNRLHDTLKEYLEKFDDIKGIYSNNARGTILLCKVIKELGKSRRIKAIGSDINKESVEYLKEGILQGIMYQNPYMQAYQAFKVIFNYIIKDEEPPERVYTDINIVLKSNLDSYI
jgi:LacI family transcriptional regulator